MEESESLVINDIVSQGDIILIGMSNGNYYTMQDGEFVLYNASALDSIHKILFVNNDIWLFGYNILEMSSLSYPLRLTTSVPI